MADISGFGLRIALFASRTYPGGLVLTQFADDADPFDIPSLQIRDKAMGLNGELIVWSKANPIPITLNVIPDSDDDLDLAALFNANRVAKNKISARDVIVISGIYPDGSRVTLSQGYITDGAPGKSIASAGRMKSKAYSFVFEDYNEG